MARLANKVAIVSGAARGMGAAEATLFAKEGAKIILGDVRDDQCKAVADDINKTHGSEVAVALYLDVRLIADWTKAVALATSKFGGLDILINNAAILVETDIVNCTEADWDRVIDVNQKGTFLGMKVAVPAMRKRGGGSIVNVSSIGGLIGTPGYAAYHASKGAVRTLAKHGAVMYGAENIRCNTIYPGPVLTDMISGLNEEAYETTVRATALKRFGSCEEIAHAALFLASDDSSFITGADLTVDGGYTAI
jgi:cyclopentanol dehydrogenase